MLKGLLYRPKAGESGAITKTLAAFLDGNAGTAHDMSPGGLGVAFLQTELPLIEGREGDSGFPSEPVVHRFGIATQCESLRRDSIEDLTNRRCSFFYGADDPLRNVVGMDVMQHL